MTGDSARKRSRPAEQLVEAQRQAKKTRRRELAALPFAEKVRRVLEMQRLLYPVIKPRRPEPWVEPWNIDA